MPSLKKTFALVITEAMAAGQPIIASYGGRHHAVAGWRERFYCASHDSRPIADAMLRLARGRALNQRMGEAAHQRGASSNTWQDYGDRLLAEYARRLNSKPR